MRADSDPQILIEPCDLIQRGTAALAICLVELDQVLECNAPARADGARRKSTRFDQFDYIGAGYIQKVRDFLCGQFRLLRENRHATSLAQLGQHIEEQAYGSRWDRNHLVPVVFGNEAKREMALGQQSRELPTRFLGLSNLIRVWKLRWAVVGCGHDGSPDYLGEAF